MRNDPCKETFFFHIIWSALNFCSLLFADGGDDSGLLKLGYQSS
jgi:hypothetical protein